MIIFKSQDVKQSHHFDSHHFTKVRIKGNLIYYKQDWYKQNLVRAGWCVCAQPVVRGNIQISLKALLDRLYYIHIYILSRYRYVYSYMSKKIWRPRMMILLLQHENKTESSEVQFSTLLQLCCLCDSKEVTSHLGLFFLTQFKVLKLLF